MRHVTGMAVEDAGKARMKMEQAEARSSPHYIPILAPLHGRKTHDQFSMCLSQRTCFQPHHPLNRVDWPRAPEYAFEGNGRMEGEGFGRRLPLPRPPTNGTVNFRQLPWIRPHPKDDFEQPPTDPDDIYLDYDPPDEDEVNHFIGQNLLDALNAAPF